LLVEVSARISGTWNSHYLLMEVYIATTIKETHPSLLQ
jgi:hypothetical protein